MANYADSVLLDAIALITENKNQFEFRKENYGALNTFLMDREFSIPNLSELRTSQLRAEKAKYLKNTTYSVGSTRSCTPSGTEGDSGNINLTWNTVSTTIRLSEKLYQNNYYEKTRAMAKKLTSAMIALYGNIEAASVAYLEANKTLLQGNRTLNTWVGANGIMNVTQANKANYYNYIQTEMYAQKYTGALVDIHHVNMRAMIAQQIAQGTANSTNLQFQYPGWNFEDSLRITNGSDYWGTSYIVPVGGVAILDWIDPLNREGKSTGDKVWTTMQDIFGYPFTWQLFKYITCTDTTASGGTTQDYVENWEISLDYSLNKAPLSTANESVIYKYGLTNL